MGLRRKHWIPVVTGIIRKNDEVLVGKRPQEGNLPGVWEFPGGKIELSESPEDALIRELDEELGIQADVGDLLISTTHSYGETNLIFLFFNVPYWKGQPKPVHHTDIKWVSLSDLKTLELPEANLNVLDRLVEQIQRHG